MALNGIISVRIFEIGAMSISGQLAKKDGYVRQSLVGFENNIDSLLDAFCYRRMISEFLQPEFSCREYAKRVMQAVRGSLRLFCTLARYLR